MAAEEGDLMEWQQRELIASRTLTELAIKHSDRRKDAPQIQTNAGEYPLSEDTMEEDYSSSSSESSSLQERPPTRVGKKKGIEEHIHTRAREIVTTPVSSLPHKESSPLSSTPTHNRTTEEEVLDIAHALEDLSYIERKRTFVTGDPLIISPKPKKRRRKRHEIVRNWKCTVTGCNKSYGSEGALKTHVKLKHTSMSISDIPNISSPVRPWILSKSPFTSTHTSTSLSSSTPMGLGAGIGPSPSPSPSPSPLSSNSLSSSISLPSIHSLQFAGDETPSSESKKMNAATEGNVFPLIESKTFPFNKTDGRSLPQLPLLKDHKANPSSTSRTSFYPSSSSSTTSSPFPSSIAAAMTPASATLIDKSKGTPTPVPFPFMADARFNFIRPPESTSSINSSTSTSMSTSASTSMSTDSNNKNFGLTSTRSLAQLLNDAIDSKFKF